MQMPEPAAPAPAAPGGRFTPPPTTSRAVGWWLIVLCGMVVVMVMLGGYTRLTHSGLSMVEWQPHEVLPPSNDAEWQAAFADYKQYPEYQRINRGMSLDEFKEIYYPEFFHRLFGRLIGLVLIVPFALFLLRRKIARPMIPRIVGVMALGGLQGVIGWLMVSSGLVDRPDVSHYRLALHLMAAFAIYAWMLWLALEILLPAGRTEGTSEAARRDLRAPVVTVALLTVVAATWGAFVAGLDAGFIYNRFPMMGDSPWPDSWGSPVEEAGVVQFAHRMLGIATFAAAVWLALRLRRSELPARMRQIVWTVPLMVLVQFALGVSTLVLTVPVALGMAHQIGAMALLSTALLALAELHAPREQEAQAPVAAFSSAGRPTPA
jgi:cytochrome c oxidase assembly protein subunit 15